MDDSTYTSNTTDGEDTTVLDGHGAGTPDVHGGGVHPLQTGYLVTGLLALGGALLWLLIDQGVVAVSDGGMAWSVVLVAAGVVGLIASLGKALRSPGRR